MGGADIRTPPAGIASIAFKTRFSMPECSWAESPNRGKALFQMQLGGNWRSSDFAELAFEFAYHVTNDRIEVHGLEVQRGCFREIIESADHRFQFVQPGSYRWKLLVQRSDGFLRIAFLDPRQILRCVLQQMNVLFNSCPNR